MTYAHVYNKSTDRKNSNLEIGNHEHSSKIDLNAGQQINI